MKKDFSRKDSFDRHFTSAYDKIPINADKIESLKPMDFDNYYKNFFN